MRHWRYYVAQAKTRRAWKNVALSAAYRLGFFRSTLYCSGCSAWIRCKDPMHGCMAGAMLEVRDG